MIQHIRLNALFYTKNGSPISEEDKDTYGRINTAFLAMIKNELSNFYFGTHSIIETPEEYDLWQRKEALSTLLFNPDIIESLSIDKNTLRNLHEEMRDQLDAIHFADKDNKTSEEKENN